MSINVNKGNTMASKKIKYKIPEIVKKHPEAAVVISKLNEDRREATKAFDYKNLKLDDVKASIKEKIKNNKNIIDLFPDTELAMDILTSSVIAPLDMLTTKLTFKPANIRLPSAINQSLIEVIKTYVNAEYDLEESLDTVFKDSYFVKGAHVEVIIPEVTIDDVVHQEYNVSAESIAQSRITNTRGYVGENNITISTEMFGEEKKKSAKVLLSLEDMGIGITDNETILNSTQNAIKNIDKLFDRVSFGNEALDDNLFKDNSKIKEQPFITIPEIDNASRRSLDKPLILRPAVETVIPVHVKNEPSKHIGYFLIVDENGTSVTTEDKYAQIAEAYREAMDNEKTNFIKKTKEALMGFTKESPQIADVEKVYNDILEKSIKKKLSDGMFGSLVDVSLNTDVYRIMFERTLKAQKTNIVFIPKSMVSYFAFDYRENGTGRSKLEKLSVLFSMRAILLFTTMAAATKNGISIEKVNVVLDENDQDPEKTKEIIMSEIMKTKQSMLPLGANDLHDLVDWIHRAGYKFNIQHPDFPNIEIETETESADKIVPDTELDEKLREWIVMSMGLTMEMVESGYDSEFATTFNAKHLLLSKRVMKIQSKFNPQITEHVKRLLKNDPIIMNKLKDTIKANLKGIKSTFKRKNSQEDNEIKKALKSDNALIRLVLERYINNIEVTLPRPEVSEFTGGEDAFSKRSTQIDEVLDVVFSTDALPQEVYGDMSDDVDTVKSIFKTSLLRKWTSENNYLPEIGDLFTLDIDGKPIFNVQEEHKAFTDVFSKVLYPFMKQNKKFVEKMNKMKERLEGEEEEEENVDNTDNEMTDETSDDAVDDSETNDVADTDEADGDVDGASDDELEEVDEEETEEETTDDETVEEEDTDVEKEEEKEVKE